MYVHYMFQRSHRRIRSSVNTLSVRLGGWFEAHATGAGVFAVPLIVVLVLAAALAQRLLF